jgi:hypothetical protein
MFPYDIARKYESGLLFMAPFPHLTVLGGRLRQAQMAIGAHKPRKRSAASKRKKPMSQAEKVARTVQITRDTLRNRVYSYKTSCPRAFSELSKQFPLDAILRRTDDTPDPLSLLKNIVAAFAKLPVCWFSGNWNLEGQRLARDAAHIL